MTGKLDVLASVGTDVHRFDRLVGWLEDWYAARPAKPAMLVQHGRSRAPAIPGATAFLDHDGLEDAMSRARIVVTHGGPASITEARRHGHLPIVVARDPAFAEHVDDHQKLFTARMADGGMIRLCASAAELGDALDRGLAGEVRPASSMPPVGSRDAAVARVGRIVDDLVAERRRRPVWRRR
jgi:UDP-N-acetylglucosamine transferase subunit ALG13